MPLETKNRLLSKEKLNTNIKLKWQRRKPCAPSNNLIQLTRHAKEAMYRCVEPQQSMIANRDIEAGLSNPSYKQISQILLDSEDASNRRKREPK